MKPRDHLSDLPSSAEADENESLSFDKGLFRAAIAASSAHAAMLDRCGILPEPAVLRIRAGLEALSSECGKLDLPENCDLFAFLEEALTEKIGDAGKLLHTACSRNDFNATVLKLYVRDSIDRVTALLKSLLATLIRLAHDNSKSVIPGFLHMKKAQPLNLAQYFNACGEMFLRDAERFADCRKRANVLPLGSGALAGVSFAFDREIARELLGFDAVSENAPDAVSDRDFVAEYLFCASLTATHLCRMAEDTLLFACELGYWTLRTEKDREIPAAVQRSAGKIFLALDAAVASLKTSPLVFFGDLKEGKKALCGAESALVASLTAFESLLRQIGFCHNRMFEAAGEDLATIADVEEYLIKKGVDCREAEALSAELAKQCTAKKKPLTRLSLKEFRAVSPLFGPDIFAVVTTRYSVESRSSVGGSSQEAVHRGIISLKRRLKKI